MTGKILGVQVDVLTVEWSKSDTNTVHVNLMANNTSNEKVDLYFQLEDRFMLGYVDNPKRGGVLWPGRQKSYDFYFSGVTVPAPMLGLMVAAIPSGDQSRGDGVNIGLSIDSK
jgi:hypothetical protein